MRGDRVLEVTGIPDQRPARAVRLPDMTTHAGKTMQAILRANLIKATGQFRIGAPDHPDQSVERTFSKLPAIGRGGHAREYAMQTIIGGNRTTEGAGTVMPLIPFVLQSSEVPIDNRRPVVGAHKHGRIDLIRHTGSDPIGPDQHIAFQGQGTP